MSEDEPGQEHAGLPSAKWDAAATIALLATAAQRGAYRIGKLSVSRPRAAQTADDGQLDRETAAAINEVKEAGLATAPKALRRRAPSPKLTRRAGDDPEDHRVQAEALSSAGSQGMRVIIRAHYVDT